MLDLTGEQMAQQADLIVRLMAMAQVGVPTPGEGSTSTRPVLALHALISAYMAIGAARPECTEMAARVAIDLGSHLKSMHEEHRNQLEQQAARHNAATVVAAYSSIH